MNNKARERIQRINEELLGKFVDVKSIIRQIDSIKENLQKASNDANELVMLFSVLENKKGIVVKRPVQILFSDIFGYPNGQHGMIQKLEDAKKYLEGKVQLPEQVKEE